MQIFQEAEKLAGYCPAIHPLCMTGGVDWREDVEALDAAEDGIIFLIVTPGRLQTHLNKTEGFAERLSQLQILVLDEVDQLCSDIFRAATEEIVRSLPPAVARQSLFYSATMSDSVIELVKQSAKSEYTYIDMIQSDDISVPDQIKQLYRVEATEAMTLALWKGVQAAKARGEPKVVVILMTGRVAAYYAEAFRRASSDLEVMEIHARLKQSQRTKASERFRQASSGLLFTSDVSSRGLDYPGVTDVIQVGAPHDKAEYIHRLGRTGRSGHSGTGLLLLHEFERGFLEQLSDLPLEVAPENAGAAMPDFASMDIPKNTKAQAYYSRINHVMRNYTEDGRMTASDIMREAKCFAASVGALDQHGRPPEITAENAAKMGVAEVDQEFVYILPAPPSS